MTIGLLLVTAPTIEPVSLAEAKLHLRLDTGETSPATTHPDDTLVMALIKASRIWCEKFQNRAYITQTWTLYLDEFPEEDYIELPLPPLKGIISLSYKDGSGTLQTVSFLDPSGTYLLETDDYIVDTARECSRLWLKSGKTWPVLLEEAQAVQIQFVAGHGLAADVPDHIKQAILLKISEFYENRGDEEPGSRYEMAAKALLWLDRIVPI